MTKFSSAFLAAAFAFLASSNSNTAVNAVRLTDDNFVEMTSGKTVFIKFFAPWCGHCKSMAGDWDKLEIDFKDHDVALIGEVDCTADDADRVCESLNIQGFPTLMWGDSGSPESYEGPRSYAPMKAFADEFVTKPVCSIHRLKSCSKADKATIASVEKQSDAELLAAVQEIVKKSVAAEDQFDDGVSKIEEQFEKLSAEHQQVLATIKAESDYKFVQQIMKKRKLKIPSLDGMDDDDDKDDDDDDDDDDDNLGEGEL